MSPEDLREAIARGSEQPGVEFKSSGPRTNLLLRAKVLRAVLAMANRRDGGVIVLGITESGSKLVPTGITDLDAQTWKADELADSLLPYASPPVEFRTGPCKLDGMIFWVITVQEFADTPVLCKKHLSIGGDVYLREGACYVRPRHKAESSEVSTYADMRDLLDLAAEKALRRIMRTVHAAGIKLGPAAPTDDELFRRQLGELE